MTVQTAGATAETDVVNDVMEWAGFALLALFAYFVWPPLVFLVSGLVLIVVANLRDARRRPNRVRFSERIAQALAAYRAAGAPR